MSVWWTVLKVFTDILSIPSLTIAIIAAIGLIALKKSWSDVFSGFMRVFIALLIVVAGALTVVNALTPLNDLFVTTFGFRGVYTLEEVTTASAIAKGLGMEIGAIYGLGFILHVIIVRLIPGKRPGIRQLYLTGHVMWTMAGAIALVLQIWGIRGWGAVAIGTVMLAFYLTVAPLMVWPFVKPITKGQWSIGHTQSFGLFLFAGIVAKGIDLITGGRARKWRAEELSIPQQIAFIKQPGIISALIMIVVFLVPVIVLGPGVVEAKFSGGKNYIVWAIQQGAMFAAGVEVILFGVRTFLGEIIPAFQGISERVIPGAVPALDVPTIYPFRPTAMMLGVVMHVIVTIFATMLQAMTGSPMVILPNAIYMFFVGATTGIIADEWGGIPGVIVASILSGFWYMYLPIWAYPFLGLEKLGLTGLSMSADCGIWAIFYGSLLRLILGPPPS